MVNISTYIDFDVENNDKDPKLKVGDCVLISKYTTIFAKGYNPILLEELFVTVRLIYVIEGLNGFEAIGRFFEK